MKVTGDKGRRSTLCLLINETLMLRTYNHPPKKIRPMIFSVRIVLLRPPLIQNAAPAARVIGCRSTLESIVVPLQGLFQRYTRSIARNVHYGLTPLPALRKFSLLIDAMRHRSAK